MSNSRKDNSQLNILIDRQDQIIKTIHDYAVTETEDAKKKLLEIEFLIEKGLLMLKEIST